MISFRLHHCGCLLMPSGGDEDFKGIINLGRGWLQVVYPNSKTLGLADEEAKTNAIS